MDFTEAMHSLEKGQKIRRPNWAGFLFLDVDGNIKHAGTRSKGEKFWSLDTGKEDWEILEKSDEDAIDASDRIEIESHEVTQSRLEAMMDSTACHIKRLYYLEEIIKGQHTAMKRIEDNFIVEMEETRKALAKTVAAIPRIEEKLAKLSKDFFNLELREMVRTYKKMIAQAQKEKKIIHHCYQGNAWAKA